MFTIENGQFSLDGKPIHIYSGAMHYFRVPREYWEDRLLKLKAAGFNTVETYVCWNLHEPKPGEFHFDGMLDISEYLRLAQKVGLYAIVRPGPYICAEWDFGGFPAWLLKDKNMQLRCNYAPYLACVRRYYQALSKELQPHLEKNGGNIIAMQVENEYGSYGNDKAYLSAVRNIMEEVGMDAFLFTSDGDCDWMLSGGGLPDVFKVMNFGSRAKWHLPKLDKYQKNMPYMCGEFWCGWFDHWGDRHHTRKASEVVPEIESFLKMDASFNMYMFHGGTNFGFTAGANYGKQFEPTVTSYDYSALLNEWGGYTDTYHAVRKLLCEKQGITPPSLPAEPKRQYIGEVKLTEKASLFDNLDTIAEKHSIAAPESMEYFGQNFGCILYSVTMKGTYEPGKLCVEGVHDNAYLFINGKLKKTYYRHENPKMKDNDGFTVLLPGFKGERKIDILVSGMGRVNYGKHLCDRKGLARVTFGNQILFGFDVYTIPLDNIEKVRYQATNAKTGPMFYKGTFRASTDADCFVDTTGFKKGCVYINGFNLGRYWAIGPQVTLYVPKGILKKENEIVVFEEEGAACSSVQIIDAPKLEKEKKRFCLFKK